MRLLRGTANNIGTRRVAGHRYRRGCDSRAALDRSQTGTLGARLGTAQDCRPADGLTRYVEGYSHAVSTDARRVSLD